MSSIDFETLGIRVDVAVVNGRQSSVKPQQQLED